jgi:hypothetical protein
MCHPSHNDRFGHVADTEAIVTTSTPKRHNQPFLLISPATLRLDADPSLAIIEHSVLGELGVSVLMMSPDHGPGAGFFVVTPALAR